MLQGNAGKKKNIHPPSQRLKTGMRLQDQWNEGRWWSRQNGIPQNCNKVGPEAIVINGVVGPS